MPSLGYVIMCYLIVREEEFPTSERVPDICRTYWKVEEYREVGFAGFINDFQKNVTNWKKKKKQSQSQCLRSILLKIGPRVGVSLE